MITAKDLMNAQINTVDPEDTVEEVMRRMLTEGISGLPVVDMSGQLVGIITEFDLLDLAWDTTTSKNNVYHYMTRNVRTVDEEDELADVTAIFRMLSVRRLLVMRDEQVVGVISRRDLIRYALQIRGQLPQLTGAEE